MEEPKRLIASVTVLLAVFAGGADAGRAIR